MRKYPQDQCEDAYRASKQSQQFRYTRKRPDENGLRYGSTAGPNSKSDGFFEYPPRNVQNTDSTLVPNYEQPALPYYVVPVLYVPQKVLSDEEILPSSSSQQKNIAMFANYVRQTNQQRRVMLEDYDIPSVTCKNDPQIAINSYNRNHPKQIYPDYYSVRGPSGKVNMVDEGDYTNEEETEVEEEEEEDDEEEEHETEYEEYETFHNTEYTVSSVSIRDEAEDSNAYANVAESPTYEAKPVRHFNSQPIYKNYRDDQGNFYSRPYKSMQVLEKPLNLQQRYEYYDYSPQRKLQPLSTRTRSNSFNYDGDLYHNQVTYPNQDLHVQLQERANKYVNSKTYANTEARNDPPCEMRPQYYQHQQNYVSHQIEGSKRECIPTNLSNLNPQTNYTIMQNYSASSPPTSKVSEYDQQSSETEAVLSVELLPQEKRPTCEDILRSYMEEKHISLESVRKTSRQNTSSKHSIQNCKTPPCKENFVEEVDVIRNATESEIRNLAKPEEIKPLNPNKPITQNKSPFHSKLIEDETYYSECLQKIDKSITYTESSLSQSVTSYTSTISKDTKTPHKVSGTSMMENDNKEIISNSPLANFVKTLSLTAVSAKSSPESNTLKIIDSKNPSVNESRTRIEERALYSPAVPSESVVDTKSTQTIDSSLVTTTASTQTEQSSKAEEQSTSHENDFNKLLRVSRESTRALPAIDIFQPLTKPRDYSPSTFFQKYRKQTKPCPVLDFREKTTICKTESTQKAKPVSLPRTPPKSSNVQNKPKKGKKK